MKHFVIESVMDIPTQNGSVEKEIIGCPCCLSFIEKEEGETAVKKFKNENCEGLSNKEL